MPSRWLFSQTAVQVHDIHVIPSSIDSKGYCWWTKVQLEGKVGSFASVTELLEVHLIHAASTFLTTLLSRKIFWTSSLSSRHFCFPFLLVFLAESDAPGSSSMIAISGSLSSEDLVEDCTKRFFRSLLQTRYKHHFLVWPINYLLYHTYIEFTQGSSETRSRTSISHWCCVNSSFSQWAFPASRYSFNTKFPIRNEVAICEIPRKLIKCFFASVIFHCSLPTGILLRCLPKEFSSPHP